MKKKGIIVLALIISFILFDAFVLDTCIDGNGKSEDIVSLLQTDCNCESIIENSSSAGLSMIKGDGLILGNTYSFTLENCMFDTSEHFEKIITKGFSDFKDVELVELIIRDDSDKENVIIIKNGKL